MTVENRDLERLLEGPWEQRQSPQGSLKVEGYLGKEDADNEWDTFTGGGVKPQADPARDYVPMPRPEAIFTLIPAFREFASPSALFLYGRRGTGKTAILRMLQHKVRTGQSEDYRLCWVLQTEGVHTTLCDIVTELKLDFEPKQPKVTFVASIWTWVVWTCVCAELRLACGSGRLRLPDTQREHLENYLRSIGVKLGSGQWHFTSAVDKRLARVLNNLDTAGTTPSRLRHTFIAALEDDLYQRARETAENILQDPQVSPVLILIDSPDSFDLSQSLHFEGLLKCLAGMARGFRSRGLLAKASIPSEMYRYIEHFHPDRTGGTKELFIRWSYQDLLPFVALRLGGLLGDRVPALLKHDLKSKEGALLGIQSVLPSFVHSRNGLKIAIIPYLLRHTQKTPRQLLYLLNAVISAARQHNVPWERLSATPAEVIRWGIHGQLSHLIGSIASIPERIDNQFLEVIRRTLTRNRSFFRYGDLDKFMRPAREVPSEHFDSREQWRRAMINSGLLGVLRSVHYNDAASIWIMTASYEYQVKDTLQATPRDVFVAHPILYEPFEMLVNRKTFIYPFPYEDEEKDELARLGIVLT
jgi:hypothetical protein